MTIPLRRRVYSEDAGALWDGRYALTAPKDEAEVVMGAAGGHERRGWFMLLLPWMFEAA